MTSTLPPPSRENWTPELVCKAGSGAGGGVSPKYSGYEIKTSSAAVLMSGDTLHVWSQSDPPSVQVKWLSVERSDVADFDAAERHSKTRSFLKRLRDLSAAGEVDEGIDAVIDFFEDLLEAGDHRTCALALTRADPSHLDTAIALAILSMTFVERAALRRSRAAFYKRLSDHLRASLPESEVARLMQGLA